jgi:hypothetical protein
LRLEKAGSKRNVNLFIFFMAKSKKTGEATQELSPGKRRLIGRNAEHE